ncbi:MAG: hypothetical protein QOF32_1616 [Gammaproteobacteria bacterium]|jgi:hypothetical protein|nr:hypothetical protein [Gammaproteobacteria bacterium]
MTLQHADRRDGINPVIALQDLRAPAICLDDRPGVFHRELFLGDPRLPDLVLARRLGFEKLHNIRKLIERNRAELESYGPLAAGPTNILRDGEKSRRRGRPGTAYQLNEGQSLILCALSRTPAAAQIRREIVLVFMAWRQGRTPATAIVRHLADHAEVLPAGDVAFLIAPVTAAILDSLSAFESELEDGEDGGDAEPSLSGVTCAPTWFTGEQTIDCEVDHEDEPALGATSAVDQSKAWSHNGLASEDEPSLAAPERHPVLPWRGNGARYTSRDVHDNQRLWAAGTHDDREQENEHGGDVLDEPHDGEGDSEPSLAATNAIDQRRAWQHNSEAMWAGSGESEPSLGWTDGRGHPETAMRGYDDDREADPAEMGIADQAALSGANDAERAVAREQRAMRSARIRLSETVVRIRRVGEPKSLAVPSIVAGRLGAAAVL